MHPINMDSPSTTVESNYRSFDLKACGSARTPDASSYTSDVKSDVSDEKPVVGSNDFQAVFNTVMIAVGIALLALGKTTASVGYLPALLFLIFCGFVGYLMIYLLYRCREMAFELGADAITSYEDIGSFTFGRIGHIIVAIALHVSLIGSSCVLILLLGQNSYHIYSGISVTWWIIIWMFILLPVNWLKTMREIGYISSTIGVVSIITTIIGLCVAGFVEFGQNHDNVDYELAVPDPLTLIGAYTTFSFCFSVTCGTTTVTHDMKNPAHSPVVFLWACVVLFAVYLVVTVPSYLGWGQALLCYDNVSDAMNKDVWGYISFVSIVVLCATHYAVVLHPSCRAIEVLFGLEEGSARAEKWGYWPTLFATSGLRSILVVVTAIVAITVPKFSFLVDLNSAITYCLLQMIFPPVFYMRLRYMAHKEFGDGEVMDRCGGAFGTWKSRVQTIVLICLMTLSVVASGITIYKTVTPAAVPEMCSLIEQ
ncbi:hypothetical protein FOZ61_005272 [Perkinsus olseni]|uniref:Amino acid transporter transmembrane domain-containing protein n=1 Tax=Perkinsus olseni TaxID=32597 RepID=A0A7J6LIC7_PEROL|nr:hypothetical protein FOZ61_005272 [Perkinsus olseni]KAF4663291.1 hypothetical protein FOL46_004842 [Perkinsus olseni]